MLRHGPDPLTGGAATGRAVIVTGLSGAGKASILRALEDIGYEAVDNPPLNLLYDLLARSAEPVAIGVDARSRGFDARTILETIERAAAETHARPELIYASAEESVLLRRYTETRRRHPLAPQGRIVDGIEAEALLTAPLREAATLVLDTSDLPLVELRRVIEQRYGALSPGTTRGLTISLISFAFPAGLPREAEMVFDVRFLRNPHYVPAMRDRTGLDEDVAAYVESDEDFAAFYSKVYDLLDMTLPRFSSEGKKYVTIAVGCTGGQHRSVHVVERLKADLARSSEENGFTILTTHRELSRKGLLPKGPQ